MINDQIQSNTPDVQVITDVAFTQIMSVMGLKHPSLISRILYLFLSSPIKRMAAMVVELDQNIYRNLLGVERLPLQREPEEYPTEKTA